MKKNIIILGGIFASTTESKPRELIPAGTYMARCYKMLHIGTAEEEVNGEKKVMNKVRIGWELPDELRTFKEEDGPKPMVIEKKYTLSLHEKATLRHHLKSWRGTDFTAEEVKSFDITKLIGVPCLLSITHRQSKTDPNKYYEEISSIGPLMKGMVCPAPINPKQLLTYTDWDNDTFQRLPDWIKEEIKRTDEYKSMMHPGFVQDVEPTEDKQDEFNDLPF